MNLYMIRRTDGWGSPEELQAAAKRSTEVAESDFPDSIRWIRSYVVDEGNGKLGTFCVYEASDPEAVRAHAGKVDMPADAVLPIVDTVIVRPDPVGANA